MVMKVKIIRTLASAKLSLAQIESRHMRARENLIKETDLEIEETERGTTRQKSTQRMTSIQKRVVEVTNMTASMTHRDPIKIRIVLSTILVATNGPDPDLLIRKDAHQRKTNAKDLQEDDPALLTLQRSGNEHPHVVLAERMEKGTTEAFQKRKSSRGKREKMTTIIRANTRTRMTNANTD